MKFLFLNIFFIATAVFLFFVLQDTRSFLYALAVLAVLHVVTMAVAAFNFRLNFFLKGIHRGKPGKLAITFDDGPHPIHTPAILEILKKYNAPAAFFLIGKNAEAHADIVKNIFSSGHEIGNHTYSHSKMNGFFSAAAGQQEIEKANAVIESVTGAVPQFFRPPFGVTNPNIAKAVKATGVTAVGWDLRSYDTMIADEKRLLQRIQSRLKDSTILLLHDTKPVTVKVLPQILEFCKNNGIEIVSLRETVSAV